MSVQREGINADLSTEVEETMGAVDIVEGSEGGDWSVHKHGVESQSSLLGPHDPVGVGPTHKHLHAHTHNCMSHMIHLCVK